MSTFLEGQRAPHPGHTAFDMALCPPEDTDTCSHIADDKMKKRFAQLFVGKNNRVFSISNQFDVSIDNSS